MASGFSQPLSAVADARGSAGGTAGPRTPGQSGDDRAARAGGRKLPTSAGEGAAPPTGGEREPTAVERWNQMGRPQAAFMVRSLSQEEQQDIEYNLSQVSAVTRSAAPQGQIRLAAGQTDLAGRIKVEVVLTQAGQKEEFSFFLDKRLSLELEYQIVVNYKTGFAIGNPSTEAASPWMKTTTLNLDIDPAEVAALFPVNLIAGQIDWEAINAVEATIHYDDPAPSALQKANLILRQAAPDAAFHVRPTDALRRGYELDVRFLYTEGEPATERLEGSGAKTFVLNQPMHRSVPISITAADALGRFAKIITEMKYAPGGGRPEQHKVVTLTGNGATETWTIFRDSPEVEPEYEYRTTLLEATGAQTRSDWRKTTDRALMVGEIFEDLLKVTVRLLVPNFQAANLLGVKLDLSYPDAAEHADADREQFFQAPLLEGLEWVVPKKPGGGDQYEYTVTWISTDGSQRVVGPRSVSDEELILHPALGE